MEAKIVLASNNQSKIQEINKILNTLQLEIISQRRFSIPEIEETGLSFIENALLKARHASGISKLPSIGDDSGIIVDILGYEPGLYSARYAGINVPMAENIAKLINNLKKIKNLPQKITAKFICVIAFVESKLDPLPEIFQGIWQGEVLLESKGNNGFGYDPIFYIPEYNCTAAELSSDLKNKISHRAKALEKVKIFLHARSNKNK